MEKDIEWLVKHLKFIKISIIFDIIVIIFNPGLKNFIKKI